MRLQDAVQAKTRRVIRIPAYGEARTYLSIQSAATIEGLREAAIYNAIVSGKAYAYSYWDYQAEVTA
jgi:hypothetical protein